MLVRSIFLMLLAVAGFSANSDLGLGPAPVTSAAPSGAAGGDLGGTYPNPTVVSVADVSAGVLPAANGGTGVANAGTITNATATTITGGGTLALGGFTLTAPATGTAALIGTANTFTQTNAFAAITATNVTNSALTATRVTIAGASGLASDDAGLTYVAASDLLVINHNAAAAPAAPTGTQIQVLGIDATSGVITIEAGAAQSSFLGRRANTSIGSPSALALNDTIVQVAAQGYGTTGYSSSARAIIRAIAAEVWTDTNQGTGWQFLTSKTGAASAVTTFSLTGTAAGATANFPLGTLVTISDTTASTTTAGALLIGTGTAATSVTFGGGNANIGGTLTTGGTVTATAGFIQNGAFSFASGGTKTTQLGTGNVGFWRSGGTIGTAGDMILQSDLGVTNGAFVFRGGNATPITVATIAGAGVGAGTPALATVGTSTITGGVTDGYNASLRLTPTYDAATALTVTRHNYIDLVDTTLTGAGPAALTDAAVFRFNANAATHKALAANGSVAALFTATSAPTGAQTTIQGWMKINVNGTLRYIPFWEQEVFGSEWRESANERINHYPTRFLSSQASRPYERSNVMEME